MTNEERMDYCENKNNNKRFTLAIGPDVYEITGSKLKELTAWLAANAILHKK